LVYSFQPFAESLPVHVKGAGFDLLTQFFSLDLLPPQILFDLFAVVEVVAMARSALFPMSS